MVRAIDEGAYAPEVIESEKNYDMAYRNLITAYEAGDEEKMRECIDTMLRHVGAKTRRKT